MVGRLFVPVSRSTTANCPCLNRLHILRMLVGKIPPNPLWAELVWQRQQDLSLFTDPNSHAAAASPPR